MECNDYNESGKMNHHVFQPYPHSLPSYEEKTQTIIYVIVKK